MSTLLTFCDNDDIVGHYFSLGDGRKHYIFIESNGTYKHQYLVGANPPINGGRWEFHKDTGFLFLYGWVNYGPYFSDTCQKGCEQQAKKVGAKLIFVPGFDEVNFEKE